MDKEYKMLKSALIRQSNNKAYLLSLEDILQYIKDGWKLEELDFDDIKFLFKMFCGRILETEPNEETQERILGLYHSIKTAGQDSNAKDVAVVYFKNLLLPMWKDIK